MRTSCVSVWTAPRPWARGRQGPGGSPTRRCVIRCRGCEARTEACDAPGPLRRESPCDPTEPGLRPSCPTCRQAEPTARGHVWPSERGLSDFAQLTKTTDGPANAPLRTRRISGPGALGTGHSLRGARHGLRASLIHGCSCSSSQLEEVPAYQRAIFITTGMSR
jgi:hypothetical protein